jgi:hypothetical protein
MFADLDEIRANTQQTLIDFLRIEIALGCTFMQSAMLAGSFGHLEHEVQAKQNAVKAADTVRHFAGDIVRDTERRHVETQLAELEWLISGCE